MAEHENIAVAQQGYNNFKTGNIAALVDQATDDIVWQLPEVEGIALSGTRTGRDGVTEFFATVARDQEVIEFEPPPKMTRLWCSDTIAGASGTPAASLHPTSFMCLRFVMARSPRSASTLTLR